MRLVHSSETLKIPEGVTVDIKGRHVTVTGKYGTLSRSFRYIPVDMKKIGDGNRIKVEMWFSTPRMRACIRTLCSHIENMFTGVMKQFQYKMRLVAAHFPINVNIVEGGSVIEIRNFMGEKRTRVIKLLDGVKVDKAAQSKDELTLQGCDVEKVSRSAALIHQSTLVKGKDIRRFLDGIYVSEKGTVEEEE